MVTRGVEVGMRDGHRVAGALAEPPGKSSAPAIVIVHEWWGLNEGMHQMAERFAAEGFLALAIDLYRGRSTYDGAEAMALANALSTAEAMKDIALGVRFLKEQPRSNGEVVITGFCLGGAMALAAICNVDGLSAAVPFYGIPKPEFLDFAQARGPILAHFGKQDPIIPAERPIALAEQAQAAGASFELHLYDAGHAFMRERDPDAYDADSANLAWERTVVFLREHLSA
jgi:carboxymethylenebutenolidase